VGFSACGALKAGLQAFRPMQLNKKQLSKGEKVGLVAGDELVLQVYSRQLPGGSYPTYVFVPAEEREVRWGERCCCWR
jgi:hypothetical protein